MTGSAKDIREDAICATLMACFHITEQCLWRMIEDAKGTQNWYNKIKQHLLIQPTQNIPSVFKVGKEGPDAFWSEPYTKEKKPPAGSPLEVEVLAVIDAAFFYIETEFEQLFAAYTQSTDNSLNFSTVQKKEVRDCIRIAARACKAGLNSEPLIDALKKLRGLYTGQDFAGTPRELKLPV